MEFLKNQYKEVREDPFSLKSIGLYVFTTTCLLSSVLAYYMYDHHKREHTSEEEELRKCIDMNYTYLNEIKNKDNNEDDNKENNNDNISLQ